MKTKEKAETLNKKFEELTEDALDNVVGGLDYTSNNLTASSENVQFAESTFRDADMSKELTPFSKNTILEQTQNSMQSQINQASQGVLNLIQ